MKVTYGKKEFLNVLKKGDYVVSSIPFGCQEGYSKIIARRNAVNMEVIQRFNITGECNLIL